MKRRYRRALNALSLGFLFFALYLNFVRKEASEVSAPSVRENSGQSQGDQFKQTSGNLSAGHSLAFELK